MIDNLKNLFKSKETIAKENQARENAIRQELLADAARKRLEQEEHKAAIRLEIYNEKMNSSRPWFEEIEGAEDEALLSNRYHWNQAFIKDLLKKGHTGETDTQVVQSYLDSIEEAERQKILEEEREKQRNSSEPWVEVIGQEFNADGDLKIQLDWNDAFIKYLRSNGFKGQTDDILVQMWVSSLSRNLDPIGYQ
ncbi:hypothetical protein Xoosp13_310 [Xanthomonas phage Xoo-sp13]|nr:hypothetical protein Xoosp13_310 [Xanthomonas phage Xoo-sp13]